MWLHLVGVSLIVAALFPYISATDDLLRIEHFRAQQQSQANGSQSQSDNLMRLYEVLDSPLATEGCEISFVAFFVLVFFAPAAEVLERPEPNRFGRSPPTFAVA